MRSVSNKENDQCRWSDVVLQDGTQELSIHPYVWEQNEKTTGVQHFIKHKK